MFLIDSMYTVYTFSFSIFCGSHVGYCFSDHCIVNKMITIM